MGTHYRGTKREILALDVFIKLTRAAESVSTAARNVYVKVGLTDSQFAVLELLYHLGPQCQLHIGQKILKSRGNITMVICNLEDCGYITRVKKKPDRRFYSVQLTKKGHQLIDRIFPEQVQRIVKVMSVLSMEEQTSLACLTKKLGLGCQKSHE